MIANIVRIDLGKDSDDHTVAHLTLRDSDGNCWAVALGQAFSLPNDSYEIKANA